MNIRDISNDGLKQTINEWLEDDDKRAIIKRDPLLTANVEHLEEARSAFARLSPPRSLSAADEARIEKALSELSTKIDQADQDFDRPTRSGFALLEAAAIIVDEPASVAQLNDARGQLFPRGLTVVNLSPSEEAGVALSTEEWLDDERRKFLGTVELRVGKFKTTALALLDQQVAAGEQLGKLVSRRDKVIAERDASAAEASDDDQKSAFLRFGEARNVIVHAVSDFVRDVKRARKINAADKALLLATINRLSRLAEPRGKGPGGQPPQ